MKKILLPIMSLMLLATGANAQTASKAAAAKTIDSTASFKKAVKQNGPMKLASNQLLVGYDGSDGSNGLGKAGFPTWQSVSGVYSDLSSNDIDYSQLKGYKLVGLNFAVAASLGDNTGVMAAIYKGDNDKGQAVSAEFTDYNVSTSNDDNTIDMAWNEVAFDEPYEFTGEETEVLYGYSYTQVTDKTADNASPILFGVSKKSTTYNGMFLLYGVPGGKQTNEGFYYVSSKETPYVPCMQLIVEDPNGEVSVIGVKGSEQAVAKQYYSLDGAQLSAPQKGLNIVKMSDGTSRKVVVK